MRAFAWFLLALLAAALIGASLAYPVFWLTSHVQPWPFHRVASRVTMLALALLLVGLCRRLALHRSDLGYALPRSRFLKVAALWSLAGMATASLGALFLLGTGLREFADAQAAASAATWVRWLLSGAASGIAVALIEETVMRGAMHSAIARESGAWAAALLTAPLFAVLHFFAKASIPADEATFGSGFVLLSRSFAPLGHPALVADSFLAWLAVGLILSLTRILTGNIAVAIGLHAGWVVVLRVLQQGSVRGGGTDYAAWVGQFDGLLGYWLLPWAAAIGAGLWLTRAAWVPYASGAGGGGASGANRSSRPMGSSSSR